MSQTFAVFAVKYAERQARRPEHFHGGDPHDVPMPMDYFVWAAVAPEHTVVVDTGFTAEVGARRRRTHLRCPTEGLQMIGVNADRVSHVVLTHFHYDHIGNLDKFPQARFVVQDAEMAFWTGRYLSRATVRAALQRLELRWGRPRLSLPRKVDPDKAIKQWRIAAAVLAAGPEATVL